MFFPLGGLVPLDGGEEREFGVGAVVLGKWVIESAARSGHLRVVRGLRERGYRWTTEICGLAAESGQV